MALYQRPPGCPRPFAYAWGTDAAHGQGGGLAEAVRCLPVQAAMTAIRRTVSRLVFGMSAAANSTPAFPSPSRKCASRERRSSLAMTSTRPRLAMQQGLWNGIRQCLHHGQRHAEGASWLFPTVWQSTPVVQANSRSRIRPPDHVWGIAIVVRGIGRHPPTFGQLASRGDSLTPTHRRRGSGPGVECHVP